MLPIKISILTLTVIYFFVDSTASLYSGALILFHTILPFHLRIKISKILFSQSSLLIILLFSLSQLLVAPLFDDLMVDSLDFRKYIASLIVRYNSINCNLSNFSVEGFGDVLEICKGGYIHNIWSLFVEFPVIGTIIIPAILYAYIY